MSTPAPDPIFTVLKAREAEHLSRLLDYLRLPTVSAEGVGSAEGAAYLVKLLEGMGLQAEAVPTDGWPVVLALRREDPALPTVLLYGHYDVQPVDPVDAWHSPPFEPQIRNGRIYARGAGDNKGQHFAQLMAIEALLQTEGRLPCNVTVMLEGEEEIGSPHLAAFVREHRAHLKADLVITSDGPVHESGRATVMFGVRGIVSFELRARGAKGDLHSGNWGGVAPQPLWTLTHLLASLRDAAGRVTVEGFYDDVSPLTALERQALDALPLDLEKVMRDLDITALDAPQERGFYERLSAWPTLTINGLHGGYGGPGSKTVLPAEAVAKCDVRLVAAQRAEDIFEKLEAHVRAHAPGVSLVRQGAMQPSKTPLDHPYAAPLIRAVARAQNETPLLVPALGGSLPDYVFTQILGLPSFVVPYANPDEANHAPNENLELWRFFAGIRTGAAMLREIGALQS